MPEKRSLLYFSLMWCMVIHARRREDNLKWKYGGNVCWQSDSLLDFGKNIRPPRVVWEGEKSPSDSSEQWINLWKVDSDKEEGRRREWTWRKSPGATKFAHQMTEAEWLTFCHFNATRCNKYAVKTTRTAMQRSRTYSMFNVFLHTHVHRWPSIGEKICLWICLTLEECNCILIWALGQTSVHSAAVKRPLHSIVFIQLSL